MISNFGIPYGRGALDIAIQVKGETGTSKTINDLAAEIQLMMDAWKERTYRSAWAYMQSCAAAVTNQGGAIITPWGTRRIFHATNDNRTLSGMRREAQNFPVQGTVAETCKIALYNMMEMQRKYPGRFKIMNQIHDAIQILVREDDVAFGEQLCLDCMGGIAIPMPSGPLCLGVDVEHFTRWGEKHD